MALNDLEFAYAPVRDQVRDLRELVVQARAFGSIIVRCSLSRPPPMLEDIQWRWKCALFCL